MSNTKVPTEEQQKIIDYNGNLAVIADPGSGKTYTLAIKIQKILENLPNYKGVIAISYTNKASDELKSRVLLGGIDSKNSYFGTIDSFFYSELILPFLPRILDIQLNKEIETIRLKDIQKDNENDFKELENLLQTKTIKEIHLNIVKKFLLQGVFFLELFGLIGLYTFKNSKTASKYLKARYSHIIIDEYQDSGIEQHQFFKELVDLSLIGIAVGDINQSIYRWAGKNPLYLKELQENSKFKSYLLTKNHRSHESIVAYSRTFLLPQVEIPELKTKRVYYKQVQGNQENIAKWIDINIENIIQKFEINKKSSIAILVRNSLSGKIVNDTLTTTHKYIENTELDTCSQIWARLFSDLLFYSFDMGQCASNIIEKWTLYDLNLSYKNLLKGYLNTLKRLDREDLKDNINIFVNIAEILCPNNKSEVAYNCLKKVINDENLLNSYIPVKDDEMQIMTIHKSKGLEFDVIFHLDLYKSVLPAKQSHNDTKKMEEDKNLHYVGITRAKKCCFLLTSTKNIVNYKGEMQEWNSNPSEFLEKINLISLRHNLK